MGIGTLTFSETVSFGWQAQNALTGSDYQPLANSTNISKKIATGTTAGNSSAGGGDELYSAILSIAASGNATVDWTSVTDILQTSGVSLARIKSIKLRLLSTTDDSAVGTAASSVTIDGTVTNGLVSQSHSGWLANSTSSFDVANGDYVSWGTVRAAGLLVDSTHKVTKVVNNDSGVTAKVQLTVCGGSS